MIESSTVLNNEKDFSKFDPIDRESYHLLGRPTDRPSFVGRPCHRTFLLAKNPIIDRIGADPIHWQMKNRLFYFIRKKPRKEEESLRQELGKQEGEARKGGARGSPSLGRLCPGSGNLSSGRLVLACALLQVVIPPVPLVFSTVLES